MLPSSQTAWNTRFYFGHQKLCMDNNKKYCPPCHKARGIHDFILATKSPVWIIIPKTVNLSTVTYLYLFKFSGTCVYIGIDNLYFYFSIFIISIV